MEGDVLRMSEHVDFGDLFTVEQFLADVKCGALIDYDGFGVLATDKQQSNIEVRPSNIRKRLSQYLWATHVMWYNR